MNPTTICTTILGPEKFEAILNELSTPQVKAVLKKGDLKIKNPSGYVSQHKRREIWKVKILGAVNQGNDELAAELLQQWLLHHRRAILMIFLDLLAVKHQHGETDESFLITRPAHKIREAASSLLSQHAREEVKAYLLYIAYQQRSPVFDDWEELGASAVPLTAFPPP